MNPSGWGFCFPPGKGSMVSPGSPGDWEPPNLSGNDQTADSPCLLTCSGCRGGQLRVRPPPEDWAWFWRLRPLAEPPRGEPGLGLGVSSRQMGPERPRLFLEAVSSACSVLGAFHEDALHPHGGPNRPAPRPSGRSRYLGENAESGEKQRCLPKA